MKIKKLIIFVLPIIILSIIAILLLTKKSNNWIDNILKYDYEIYSLSCDGTTKILDKNVLKEIKNNWNNLSDNGPFLGDLNTCYRKIIIDYNDNIADIEIIDDTSIIVKENSNANFYTYYTNADILVKYLNEYFE